MLGVVRRRAVSGGIPPTLVAAESVASMLLGVVVFMSAVFWLPQALPSSPTTKTVASNAEDLNVNMS